MDEMDPAAHYDDRGTNEWNRLTRNFNTRMEFRNTTDYLERDLPDSGRILDAGGGAGRYTVWLADRGYEVVLAEPSEGQRETAREKIHEHGVAEKVTVEPGDVRDLRFDDEAFDATLCLGGPLSHVMKRGARVRSAGELRRVTAPGGPTFVSVLGRISFLRTILKDKLAVEGEIIEHIARTGDYDAAMAAEAFDGPRWVETHLFRAGELADLLADAGFGVRALAGLEGPASVFAPEIESEASEAAKTQLRRTVRDLREDKTIADISEHILAVCRA